MTTCAPPPCSTCGRSPGSAPRPGTTPRRSTRRWPRSPPPPGTCWTSWWSAAAPPGSRPLPPATQTAAVVGLHSGPRWSPGAGIAAGPIEHEIIGSVSAVSVLERRVYVMSDVDLFLGLPSGTARRWIDGYSRGGRTYGPVIREDSSGDEIVTWGEFVETRLLAGYRARGVSLQRLRPAVQLLRREFGTPYPLATAQPYLDVAGRELIMRVQDQTGIERPLWLVV